MLDSRIMAKQSLMTFEEAQEEFQRLLELQRGISLWFMGKSPGIDITHPLAGRLLDQIGSHCSRDIWIRVRRLKSWLSQTTR